VTRIKLIGAAGLAIAAVTALPAAPAGGMSHIVYRCGPGFSNLCRIDPTSGAVTQLTRDGKPRGPVYAEPSYSRDGKKMTYTFGNDLYVARGDATHRRLLERRVVLDRLSPDGKWVTLAKILPDPVGGPCLASSASEGRSPTSSSALPAPASWRPWRARSRQSAGGAADS